MKRFTFVAVALCLAFMLAVPAMAVEADFSGHLRVRGRYLDNASLDSDNQESKARYDMRFRLRTDFKVNDNVSITTRLDAFDGYVLGTEGAYTNSAGTNLDFDRAYMTIKSSWGVSQFGRMSGGAWALPFGDYDGEYDRLRHTVKMDNITAGFIVQKLVEGDYGTAGSADLDLDVYYLFGVFGFENIKTGLLYAYVDYAHVTTWNGYKHAFLPFFKGKFGPFGVNAEVIYETGTREYDGVAADRDQDTLSYTVDANFTTGPFGVEAGWLSQSGQDNSTDFTAGNTSYGGIGEDWDKMVIFSDADQLLNLTGSTVVNTYGVDLWYVGFSYQAMEKMKLWFNVAGATANEDQGGPDDDYGIEYDANLSYQIFDGLSYTLRAGFLSAGDVWKAINGVTNVDDTYTIYHKLQVTF